MCHFIGIRKFSSYFDSKHILENHLIELLCCVNGKIEQITYIIKTKIGCGDASLNFDHIVLNHIFLNHRWRCFSPVQSLG